MTEKQVDGEDSLFIGDASFLLDSCVSELEVTGFISQNGGEIDPIQGIIFVPCAIPTLLLKKVAPNLPHKKVLDDQTWTKNWGV